MKILYFGTVHADREYKKVCKGAKKLPSSASNVFENALLDGFYEEQADADIYSFPMIPTYPTCKKILLSHVREVLDCGYSVNWLSTVNLPVLKQLSRSIAGNNILKKWLKSNKGGVVLMYSIPPFLVKKVIKNCKKTGNKCFAVVADLPENMYINKGSSGFLSKIRMIYLRKSIKYQDKFDGYVYLTEAMSSKIKPEAPYIVVEGIAEVKESVPAQIKQKSSPRVIMYAGGIHEKYGVINLIEGFLNSKHKDTQLWLFGNGSSEEKVKEYSEKYARIKFFGRCDREKILEFERMATLLINVRSTETEFTKYSFPSKTIEYMLSGTPVISTRLKGIPEEYFDYILGLDDNDVSSITKSIDEALGLSDETLSQIGSRARDFVIREKNSRSQSKRILDFISSFS